MFAEATLEGLLLGKWIAVPFLKKWGEGAGSGLLTLWQVESGLHQERLSYKWGEGSSPHKTGSV